VRGRRPPLVAYRLDREGLVHEGFELRFDGSQHRLPFTD
jgi:p-hydroxybenzoate 3-monooxygenase